MTNTDDLSRYIGGQIEIQNPLEKYLYRGEVAAVEYIDGDLKITLAWCAKRADDGQWDADDTTEYTISMLIYSGVAISEGRYYLRSEIIGETTVLFPPGGSALDPSRVRGLVRA